MQTKTYSFVLKGSDEGFVTGRASVYGNQDLDGEVVDRGAFDNWLRNRKGAIPVLWQHNRQSPVGWCNELESKDDGLHVRAKLLTDAELGRYAYAFAKAGASAGAKVGLSIGFMVEKGGSYVDRDGIKHFTSLNLLEFSIVTFPANPEAAVTGTKDGVGGDERVPVTVPSETWEGILAEAGRLKELILEPGSIMTAAERERQLQDKITPRCLFGVPRLAPRPYYYREVGNSQVPRHLVELAKRTAEGASALLGMKRVPRIVFFEDAPNADPNSSEVFSEPRPILGKAWAKHPDRIWIHADQSEQSIVNSTAHECFHVLQHKDATWQELLASGGGPGTLQYDTWEREAVKFARQFLTRTYGNRYEVTVSAAVRAEVEEMEAILTDCKALNSMLSETAYKALAA